jgi:hypothetical protein
VIHSAATVRFDHSLDEARRINVEGTRRVLDFAAGMRQLRSLAYVGTAYVAGERSDLVRESELAVGQSYRNTYEQTKAEAEALVRSRLGSVPGVILRPSIIVGDSRTGVTSSFKMMYWPLKIYARRLWRTVPGYPDAVLDIVPVDFVAASVARLAFDGPPSAARSTSARGRAAAPPFSRSPGVRQSTSTHRKRATSIQNFSSPPSGPCSSSLCGDANAACCATAAPTATTSQCACSSIPPTPSAYWSPPDFARRRCWTISTAFSTTASPATGAASLFPAQ